jgi:valyl-tRNA synthetase
MLILSSWPEPLGLYDELAEHEVDWVLRLITEVRSMRAELNVPDKSKIILILKEPEEIAIKSVREHTELIKTLTRLDSIDFSDAEVPSNAAQTVLGSTTLIIPLDDIFNVGEEKIRLGREINTLDEEIMRIDKKLENKNFTSKAPQKIIQEQKDKREGYESSRAKLQDALSRL